MHQICKRTCAQGCMTNNKLEVMQATYRLNCLHKQPNTYHAQVCMYAGKSKILRPRFYNNCWQPLRETVSKSKQVVKTVCTCWVALSTPASAWSAAACPACVYCCSASAAAPTALSCSSGVSPMMALKDSSFLSSSYSHEAHCQSLCSRRVQCMQGVIAQITT